MNSKYFANLSIAKWLQTPIKSSKGSIVWKALVEAFTLVGSWIAWKIGNGRSVSLGEDPWLGASNNYKLSDPLIKFLWNQNILHLHDVQVGDPQPRGRVGWQDVASLGLPLDLQEEWDSFITWLCENYVILDEKTKDSLCWSLNQKDGSFTAKLGYKA